MRKTPVQVQWKKTPPYGTIFTSLGLSRIKRDFWCLQNLMSLFTPSSTVPAIRGMLSIFLSFCSTLFVVPQRESFFLYRTWTLVLSPWKDTPSVLNNKNCHLNCKELLFYFRNLHCFMLLLLRAEFNLNASKFVY